MLVTISGLPGAGTTTASRLVAVQLDLPEVNGGAVFRQMAAEQGMSLADFGAYAERHHEVDRELDRRLAARVEQGGCVVESRLAGWLATRAGAPALRVWIACGETTRAARVGERERIGAEEALEQNRAREASERRRYQELYGIDLADLSIYDLVLDSGSLGPESLAREVVEAADRRFGC